MIKCKPKNCLKLEQYCVKNNVLLEVSCKHYGIKSRYYICWKAQLNLLLDGIVFECAKNPCHLTWSHCCQLLMSFFVVSLSYMNRGLLCHHVLYVARHLICAARKIRKGKGKCNFKVAEEPFFEVSYGNS